MRSPRATRAATARDAARDAHVARIERIMDMLAIAGPLKDEDGRVAGSLVIAAAAPRTEAQALLEADPYYAARVWERFEIHDFLPAAGAWIGGKVW